MKNQLRTLSLFDRELESQLADIAKQWQSSMTEF